MNSNVRYFLTAFAVIVLLIIGIVVIVRSDSDSNTVTQNELRLMDYADKSGSSVQLNMEGPINAAENHRTVRVTVTPLTRTIDIIAGYEGQVIDTKTYDNNQDAYQEFLAALQRAGYTRERQIASNNSQSVCPTGSRTHFRITDGPETPMNTWNASCTQGTFGGDVSLTNRLFQAQIPDYNTMTKNISMGSTSGSTGLVL